MDRPISGSQINLMNNIEASLSSFDYNVLQMHECNKARESFITKAMEMQEKQKTYQNKAIELRDALISMNKQLYEMLIPSTESLEPSEQSTLEFLGRAE